MSDKERVAPRPFGERINLLYCTDVVLNVADVVVLVLLDDSVGAVVLLMAQGHEALSRRLAPRVLRRVGGFVGKVVGGRDVGAPVGAVVTDVVVGVARLLIL